MNLQVVGNFLSLSHGLMVRKSKYAKIKSDLIEKLPCVQFICSFVAGINQYY